MGGVQVLGGGSLTLDCPSLVVGGRTCPYCGIGLASRGFAQQYGFCSPDHQRAYTAARLAAEEPPLWDYLLALDLRELQPKRGRLILDDGNIESLPVSPYIHTPPVHLQPFAFRMADLAPAVVASPVSSPEPPIAIVEPRRPLRDRWKLPQLPRWELPEFPRTHFGALVAAGILAGFGFSMWRTPASKPAPLTTAKHIAYNRAPIPAPVKTEPVSPKPALDPPQPPPINSALPSGGWQQWTAKDAGRTIAAYEPSLSQADYRFGFLAQIEYGAFGWAFRAHGIDEYYGMKLRMTGGSKPRLILERFRRNGRNITSMPSIDLKFPASYSNVYRVQMEIKGQRFVTYINDELVDAWEDATLKTGGVGFANETRERGKVASWRYASL